MKSWEYFTPLGRWLAETVRENAPTIWANYYAPYMGNALIPPEDMTPELWEEVAQLLAVYPYYPDEAHPYPTGEGRGFALIWYEVEEEEGEPPTVYWCLTDILEP